jgi:hypothetical protein
VIPSNRINSAFVCGSCGKFTSPFNYGVCRGHCSDECREIEEAAELLRRDSAERFVKMGDTLVPWNGTIPK